MAYKNIEDSRAAIRRHYYANKELYIEKNRRHREMLRQMLRDLKEGQPCKDCGKKYPYYVMDFDHLEGKEGLVSYFAKNIQKTAMLKELKKCEIVCSNCHRIRTFKRINSK